jgi:predicted MFS family arabinose efflux permease
MSSNPISIPLGDDECPPKVRPESRTGQWTAVIAMSVIAFILVTSEFLPVGILNILSADLNISAGSAGATIVLPGLSAALAAIAAPYFGRASDRRIVVMITVLAGVVGNLISAGATSYTMLLVGRLFQGIAVGGFWSVALGIVTRIGPQGIHVAKVMSVYMLGVTAATVLGVPLATWLTGAIGWRPTFALIAGVCVAAMLGVWRFVPRVPAIDNYRFRDLGLLLTVMPSRVGFVAILLVGTGHFMSYAYLAPFLKHAAHFDVDLIAITLLIYGAGGIVGTWIGGHLGSRDVRYGFLATAVVLMFSIGLLPLLASSTIAMIVLVSVWGIAWGCFPMLASTWMYVTAPDKAERGISALVVAFQIMIGGSALAGGWLVDHAGVDPVLLLGAFAALCGALVVLAYAHKISLHSGTPAA